MTKQVETRTEIVCHGYTHQHECLNCGEVLKPGFGRFDIISWLVFAVVVVAIVIGISRLANADLEVRIEAIEQRINVEGKGGTKDK